MPEIGEKRFGGEVGYKSKKDKVTWLPCNSCGKERWVWAYNMRALAFVKPGGLCRKCSMIEVGKRPKPKREKSRHWKGGRIKTSGGYIGIYLPEYHRCSKEGYVSEHIYVWEMATNKILPGGWIIHHLNGIKDDNRIENLEALSDRTHKKVIGSLKRRILNLETELNYYKNKIKEIGNG